MGKTKIKTVETDLSKLEDKTIDDKKKPSPTVNRQSSKKTRGQKYQQARELVDPGKAYPLKEAVELAQKVSYSKFTGTLEIHLNTNAKNLRGLVTLPFMAGKKMTVLGPKGLMPNPKNGTITENLTKAVADLKGGKTEYKSEPNGQVVHLAVGKTNQPAEEITANIKALYNVIGRSKVKKITLAPSMGPGVKIDLSSIWEKT